MNRKNCKSLLIALALAALTTTSSLAQQAAVTSAILSQRNGKLDVARTEIDKAITDEKTNTKAKTWFTRGLIYEELITHPIFGKTAPPNSAQIAYESYQKAIQYDEKGKEFAPQAKEKMKNLFGAAFNAGVNSFNAKDYDAAIKAYELAASIMPQDTGVALYTAYAYEGKKDMPGAEKAYRNALTVPLKPKTKKDIYYTLLRLSREKPEAEQLSVAREAVAAYPNEKDFLLQEISVMLKMGQEKEAIDKVQNAIKLDPKNSNLYAVLGTLYDKSGKPEQAVTVYEQAIAADPTNFDAQFNLGVYQFNRGAEMTQKLRNMSPAEYAKLASKKMQTDSKVYFQKAVPYFETALKLKSCDKSTLASLEKAYVALNQNADAERIGKITAACTKK
ncbi:MAG: tetratricopeptide repeat protein [Hymenobacteraceae bacterium]|nr:tetratricopeptide repeat protein [Hymenobacteraceae bacterium]